MIEQILIAVLGVVAIWCSQCDAPYNRYACLFGMAGQPFWFIATYQAEQWGIFILAIFYTVAWAKGINKHWIGRAKRDAEPFHYKSRG